MDTVSFLIFALCVNHIYVSGQYTQYKYNNDGFKPIRPSTEKPIDLPTQPDYEYYDDDELDSANTPILGHTTATTTTTTTTTTQRPSLAQRYLATRRSNSRSANFNKVIIPEKPYVDNYLEASNEFEILQQPGKKPLALPLRNTIFDVDHRANGKEYSFSQEKASTTSAESNNINNGNFSRRYARFLFKLRTG